MQRIAISLLAFVLLVFTIAGCLPEENLAGNAVQVAPESTPTIAVTAAAVTPETINTAIPVDGPNRPESVALMFYRAYREAKASHKPSIGSAGFSATDLISQAYLAQLAEIEASFDGGGYDPVFQTQAVPPDPVEVKEFNTAGSQATVVIQFGRGRMEKPWERTVSLEKIDGNWEIVPDRVKDGGKSPAETVQAFYDWYLGYIGSGGQQRNPLADRAYRAAPFIERALIDRVDRMLEAGEGLGYDPFLCAQDIPAGIKVSASFYNAARPVVVAQGSFPGSPANHSLVIDLARENFNRWIIRRITCGSTPEGTAKAFYTWALGYMTQAGEQRNPWADGAYRDNPFLARAFIQRLDGLMASGAPAADPVLFAQDIPQAFNVERCRGGDCALVNMQFGDATIRQVRVDLADVDHSLKISAVQPALEIAIPQPAQTLAGVESWATFLDAQYGYGLRYPANWRAARLKVTDTHTPEAYPVMRSIQFFSPALDGSVIDFGLDVVVEDETTLQASYGFSEQLEKTTVNGYPVTVYRSEPGCIYYVFQHPARPNVWIVLTDCISRFSGREEMAKKIAGVFERMVSTVSFSQ